jgi:hypothetical protein
MGVDYDRFGGFFVKRRVQFRDPYGSGIAILTFNEDKTEVGLEFSEPVPRFWRITFPPEDWNPADRKLPTAPQMPQPSTSK